MSYCPFFQAPHHVRWLVDWENKVRRVILLIVGDIELCAASRSFAEDFAMRREGKILYLGEEGTKDFYKD